MSYHSSPATDPPALIIRDGGLLILRLAAGLGLICFHAWREALSGWQFFWRKEPWIYAAEIAERGFPLPEIVAAVSAGAGLLFSGFLAAGLLGRLPALVLLLCALTGIFLYAGVPLLGEMISLYAAVYLVLTLCGPGRFSLDSLLRSGSR
jgi:uncharacterized membrane protein YphA (DoxX/SURF4 family)